MFLGVALKDLVVFLNFSSKRKGNNLKAHVSEKRNLVDCNNSLGWNCLINNPL